MLVADEVSQQAADLVTQAGLSNIFPVPMQELAEYLGFRCHFYIPDEDINDIAGAVSHLKKMIYINQNNTSLQQRLCIARKLGCIILYGPDQDYIEYLRATGDPKDRMIECFAENLLLPAAVFKQKWYETNQNINELVQFFGVSQWMITGRAGTLRLRYL